MNFQNMLVLIFSLFHLVKMKIHSWNGNEQGGRIYFYEGVDQTGQGYVLDIGFSGACYRIKNYDAYDIQSVDTNGACIYIFSDNSCAFSGPWRKIRRYQSEANDLSLAGLRNGIQSVRSCSAFLVPIYLYEQPNFKGTRLRLDIFARHGCTNIRKDIRDRETCSVRLNDYEYCVIIYATLNCQGQGLRIRGPCSPEALDLAAGGFNQQVISLQTCTAAHRIHARRIGSSGNSTIEMEPDNDKEIRMASKQIVEETYNDDENEIEIQSANPQISYKKLNMKIANASFVELKAEKLVESGQIRKIRL